MYLYHYYDREIGPFMNISELSEEKAEEVREKLRHIKPGAFCNQRDNEYMHLRHYYEDILRKEFKKKGGRIERKVPQYMVIGECPFLEGWYEKSAYLKIDVEDFDKRTLSFTYGDSHPTFSDRVRDGKEYRKKLYTYEEILQVIEKYGYPQEWNPDGAFGPERYIEVHIWSGQLPIT